MRRIKRTKITVIRTETVFLRVKNGCVDPDFAREIIELQAAGLEQTEPDSVLEIEAIKQDSESQGEVK